MASPLGELNLLALADAGITQAQERSDSLYGQQLGWSNSAVAEQQGLLASLLSGDQRSQEFDSQQNMLDAALKRQQASMAAATARASQAQDGKNQAAENEEWRLRQIFSTDEAIRQALSLAGDEPDPPGTHARDFGGSSISSARGRALKTDGLIQHAPNRAEMDRIIQMVGEYGLEPTELMTALRRPTSKGGFGSQTRKVSLGLANMGYDPPG